MLSTIPYHDVPEPKLKLPHRPESTGYVRTARDMQTFVPDHAATLLSSGGTTPRTPRLRARWHKPPSYRARGNPELSAGTAARTPRQPERDPLAM
jgi:hypothetical protein